MITFFRRKKLGAGSTRGMVAFMEGKQPYQISAIKYDGTYASIIRNDKLDHVDTDWLVRWGCTTATSVPVAKQLNISEGIHLVSNKLEMRKILHFQNESLIPSTIWHGNFSHAKYPLVVRPKIHAQGKHLWVVNNEEQLQDCLVDNDVLHDGWYASEFIDKVAEYRVYVVSGRVATVARKTPADPSAVAWNVAQGGSFDVVPWGQWPMEAIRVAIEAFKYSLLDFSGVDVMVDAAGRAYVIELNSAPSLPGLSDGSISYRQKCMAKYFSWVNDHGKEHLSVDGYDSWKQVIHPAIVEKDDE